MQRLRLGYALLGGAIAWFLHLLASYLIAEFACVSGMPSVRVLGISATAWMLLLATLVLLAVALGAMLTALGAVRARSEAYGEVARIGLLLDGLATLVILVESLPILFYLRGC